jgi:argonaute-like protein implicated in RNA metabolism and viral defense
MKDIIVLQEKANLLEQEVKTLTEKIIKLEAGLKEVEDVRLEIKGLKVFLGRMHPEFKSQLPEILKKLKA